MYLVGCNKPHLATPAAASTEPDSKAVVAAPHDMPQGVDPAAPAKAPPAPTAQVQQATDPAPAQPTSPTAAATAKAATTAAAKSPAPVAPKTTPEATKPAAPQKAVLPQTKHVRFEIGAAMQKLLDADPRMVDWTKRIIPVIDKCYKDQPVHGSGVIKVTVIMHDKKGPDTAIQSLPPQFAGMLPCATSRLMSVRPPLFTGPEGQKHSVGIRFSP